MKHPLHAICPYFAMFPEEFVQNALLTFTRPGQLVLDPFCGRGTAILESVLNNRRALGTDVNPVAACVAGAKADIPTQEAVLRRLGELEQMPRQDLEYEIPDDDFFRLCFHPETLREICALRHWLDWKHRSDDRFIAAVCLGALHGESHRSGRYLSNRMPRTISTKPSYSIRWWADRGLWPDRRETFAILSELIRYRLSVPVPTELADVRLADARMCGSIFESFREQVQLIITSPPYIDTTDYAEDQWLRLWFLGGAAIPKRRLYKDDRYRQGKEYWRFLQEVWRGCAVLVAPEATCVVRIGGRKLCPGDLAEGLERSLTNGLEGRRVSKIIGPQSSEIRRGQINAFRPGTTARKEEYDFFFRVH
jgi:DNA methylase